MLVNTVTMESYHTAHNFGKSFFFVEIDMGEPLPLHAAV